MPDRCSGCGLVIKGGSDGCQALFDEFRVYESREIAPGYAWTRLSLDVYCLQHPDRYCVSAKSLAAHLTGVAWALEYDDSERGLQILRRWLNGSRKLIKPELPVARGALTVQEVRSAADAAAYRAAVRRWAESTWEAYRDLHQVARGWIDAAMATRRGR